MKSIFKNAYELDWIAFDNPNIVVSLLYYFKNHNLDKCGQLLKIFL